MNFVFTESNSLARSKGFANVGPTEIFGPERSVESLRFQDGDKIYFLGAVRYEVERAINRALTRSGAKVAVVRER